jgi:YfiH family protein
MELLWLEAPQWKGRRGLLHGFLGRRGGKSKGPFGGLNFSFNVGDEPQAVKDNICDMKRAVGVHDLRIVTMRQMHGDRIVEVKDKTLKEAGECDGMITEEAGIFLGALTADCVPMLFCVPDTKLVAVVHVGWRGTLLGLAQKMVMYLGNRFGLPSSAVEVALGPAIGPCCYEIGEDVASPIQNKWGALARKALRTENGKAFLDLKDLNTSLLREAGVLGERITQVGSCTSCSIGDFFSYRRDGGTTGRQISFVGWLA